MTLEEKDLNMETRFLWKQSAACVLALMLLLIERQPG